MDSCRIYVVCLTFSCISLCIAQENLKAKGAHPLPPFTRLFKHRRLEQIEAVKRLLAIDSYEKQYKMVNVIADKVFEVIQTGREILESSGYVPGNNTIPKEHNIHDALANVLENTALFSDIVVHLPDVTQRVLASKREWMALLEWSLDFSNKTTLLDKATVTLMSLVSQELNITERQPTYINPYRKYKPKTIEKAPEENKRNSAKKKRNIKKGPRLSGGVYNNEL